MIAYNVEHNPSQSQFQVEMEGYTAFLKYRDRPGRLVLVHTEVPPELRGRGIADALAKGALDYARENNLKVTPLCPFVQKYLERHPEEKDLVKASPGGAG